MPEVELIESPSVAPVDKWDGLSVLPKRVRRKVWEPWSLRTLNGVLDDNGQDCFANFLARDSTTYYCEPQVWTGSSLTVFVQPGMQNAGTINPLFQFRIYGQTEVDAYGAIQVYEKTWTNLAAGATPTAVMFNTANPADTTAAYMATRAIAPTMFDFVIRSCTTTEDSGLSAPVIQSWTVRVVGIY